MKNNARILIEAVNLVTDFNKVVDDNVLGYINYDN